MGERVDKVIAMMEKTGHAFYSVIGIFALLMIWGGYAWYTQFTQGMRITGLNNTVMWGFYIATFMFMIGVAHAGIIISTLIRSLNYEKLKPIARIAEIMTVSGLTMAVLSVVADLGRPDRILVLFLNLRVGSPLAWDLIILSLYFAFTLFYLVISTKHDVKLISDRFEIRGIIYKILIPIQNALTPKDDHAYEKMLRYVAIIMLPFPILDSGMVVAFIFSLLGSRPALNVPYIGPYFLLNALVTGIASVVIVAVILAKVYKWEDMISNEVFKSLAKYMQVGLVLVLYFIFNQHFTWQYVGKPALVAVSDLLLGGGIYSLLFWEMIWVGFILPIILLFTPDIEKEMVFLASIFAVLGLWVNCILTVVPALSFPNLPFNWSSYAPTWVEWSIISGIFGLGVIIYAVLIKVLPPVELD